MRASNLRACFRINRSSVGVEVTRLTSSAGPNRNARQLRLSLRRLLLKHALSGCFRQPDKGEQRGDIPPIPAIRPRDYRRLEAVVLQPFDPSETVPTLGLERPNIPV